MSVQLRIDEALDLLQRINPEQGAFFEAILCNATDAMAQILGEHFEANAGGATMQGAAMSGICVPMRPQYRDQPCPEEFAEMDDGGAEDWAEDARERPHKVRKWRYFAARDGDTHTCVIRVAGSSGFARQEALQGAAIALRCSHLTDVHEIAAELDGFHIEEEA